MSESMYFYQPGHEHDLPHDPFNAIIAPRPIGWISSVSAAGQVNLAPYSFFNAFNYHPPLIGFSSIGFKDTVANIEATKEFCWNLVTQPLAEKMNLTSQGVDHDVDEFVLAGLDKRDSNIIDVPQVAQSPVSMECRLSDIVQLKSAAGKLCDSFLVIGEVVGVHINKSLLHDGIYQTAKAQPLMRAGGPGDYFTISDGHKVTMMRP